MAKRIIVMDYDLEGELILSFRKLSGLEQYTVVLMIAKMLGQPIDTLWDESSISGCAGEAGKLIKRSMAELEALDAAAR